MCNSIIGHENFAIAAEMYTIKDAPNMRYDNLRRGIKAATLCKLCLFCSFFSLMDSINTQTRQANVGNENNSQNSTVYLPPNHSKHLRIC